MLPTILFALSCMITSAITAPLQTEAVGPDGVLIVVDPKITYPTQDTVWVVGNEYSVTWDNSDLPPLVNITNLQGKVVLGQFNGNGERLYTDNPLAQGFLITDTKVQITVPKVADGNYIIVLFGDSGNQSPQFRIVNNPLSSILNQQSTSSSTSSQTSSITSPSTIPTADASESSPTPAPVSTTLGTSAGVLLSSSPLSVPASITATEATPQVSETSTASPSSNDAASWWNPTLMVFVFTSAAISATLAL